MVLLTSGLVVQRARLVCILETNEIVETGGVNLGATIGAAPTKHDLIGMLRQINFKHLDTRL